MIYELLNKGVSLIPPDEIEQEALNQLQVMAEHDFVKKFAVMPDVHMGYTFPIGTVAVLDNVISPSGVGYDIGCGMCHMNTHIPYDTVIPSKDAAIKTRDLIMEKVPVGFNIHECPITAHRIFESASLSSDLNDKVNAKRERSLGTLGGGNHFIEIGKDKFGSLAITIHSGSRNIGHSIAGWYMKNAGDYLDINSTLGSAYIQDMEYALDYALLNRTIILAKVLEAISINKVLEAMDINSVNLLVLNKNHYHEARTDDWIIHNANHNHAIVTDDGVIHRKGATEAHKGQSGIIPGNMRDGVYITIGLGNEDVLNSASHGAGRTMSRSKARKTIDLKAFETQMENIVCNADARHIDEAPDAYKSLDDVINAQDGVNISIKNKISSEINIKG